MNENRENVQRWTAKRRVALILSILKGETSTKRRLACALKFLLLQWTTQTRLRDPTPCSRSKQR